LHLLHDILCDFVQFNYHGVGLIALSVVTSVLCTKMSISFNNVQISALRGNAITTQYVGKHSNQFGKSMLMTVINKGLNLGDPGKAGVALLL